NKGAPMKADWFKRVGWFYLPKSAPGIAICVLATLFCLTVFRAVDRHSHSVSDTLYGVFPFFTCTFLLLDWICRRTCGERATLTLNPSRIAPAGIPCSRHILALCLVNRRCVAIQPCPVAPVAMPEILPNRLRHHVAVLRDIHFDQRVRRPAEHIAIIVQAML